LDDFEKWIFRQFSRSYAKEMLRLTRKYGYVLQNPSRVSELLTLPYATRRVTMAGLANLAKFKGVYKEWKELRENSGLKWENKTSLDIVLDIINSPLKDVMEWLKEAISGLPVEYGTVLVFNALTGLRVHEGMDACKLLSDLDSQHKLDSYLNKELWMLEHFRFPQTFLRRCKNAYISLITPELLQIVLKNKPAIKYATLDTRVSRLGLPNRSKQLRKYYGTVLRDVLPTEAIDLLEGRVSSSVFARYYYKPFLKDVRNKVMKIIEPIQWELLYTLDNHQ
jgi:hypothetical protein